MRNDDSSIFSCGCGFIILLFNLFIGGWSVNYLLLFFLDKTISGFGATLIGLFVGEFSIPVAVVIWLLKAFGAL